MDVPDHLVEFRPRDQPLAVRSVEQLADPLDTDLEQRRVGELRRFDPDRTQGALDRDTAEDHHVMRSDRPQVVEDAERCRLASDSSRPRHEELLHVVAPHPHESKCGRAVQHRPWAGVQHCSKRALFRRCDRSSETNDS